MIEHLSTFLLELIEIFEGYDIAHFELEYIQNIHAISIQKFDDVQTVSVSPGYQKILDQLDRSLVEHIASYKKGYVKLEEIREMLQAFEKTYFDYKIALNMPWELCSLCSLAYIVIEQIISTTGYSFIPVCLSIENMKTHPVICR